MSQSVTSSALTLPLAYYLAPAGALLALLFALIFYKGFMRQSEGDKEMIRVAQAVRDGAYAYLGKQRNVVAIVFVGLIALLLVLSFGLGLQAKLTPLGVALASIFSGLCGYLGMKTATNASARTAEACKTSLNDGLRVAFRAGAVMGLCVVGVGLLDIAIWFFVFSQFFDNTLVEITTLMLSFALGVSLQALFARVGGGIYTKAADVGADLVGKVEAGIPEDDPRNPATIADNVGDNVGDVAGMGTDLYESYYTSIIAAMALAASAAVQLGLDAEQSIALVVAPPAFAGFGILCSILSIYAVRVKENASFAQLLKSLHIGVWLSSALIAAGSFPLFYWMIGDIEGVSWLGLWGAIIVGIVAGLVIAFGTEIYTSYEHRPTQRIAEQSETGPATVIIAGISEGMFSTWVPLLTIVVAIMASFTLAGGNELFLFGVFGIGVAAVGMLSTLGITLATDAYGPIADNAGGNAEMTRQPPHVRERTDILDSLGNTTAATGKGFAIGSAALTALALLSAYATALQSNLVRMVDVPAEVVEATSSSTSAAYYQGHGIFGILEKGEEPQAGLTLSGADNLGRLDELLLHLPETERLVTGSWSIDHNTYHAKVPDAGGTLEFEIVRASSASVPQVMTFYDVTLMNPKVLCGLFLGAMMIFLFCSMTMNAVGRAAYSMMTECRRQFALMKKGFRADGVSEEDLADPMKWPNSTVVDGKTYPDYATCVTISTTSALREMVVPSIMAVILPLLVGLVLGIPAVLGLLAGALVVGLAVAVFMANAGGAWDNAKKYIESGKLGGKGSDNHKATVVGDTVGDPFKDTSGPSLNTLIKLVSIVSIVFAGFIVKYSPIVTTFLGLN